ncbi:MAG: hypothetical protein ACFFDK_12075 [Promethearchaeota archaeon]
MSQRDLKVFLQNMIFKVSNKLKGKFSPFSEIIGNELKVLMIKDIYDLGENHKNLYLFIVKNYSKQPKERYFLAVLLASQSSDLLVSLANDFARKNALKLVQYTINLKQLRISLIALKEIEKIEDFSFSVEILKEFRTNFREMLAKIKSTLE